MSVSEVVDYAKCSKEIRESSSIECGGWARRYSLRHGSVRDGKVRGLADAHAVENELMEAHGITRHPQAGAAKRTKCKC